jgi:hypothetical protein
MAGIGLWAQKAMLDFTLKGASPTAPPGVYCGLSLTAPSSVASNEVATGSGYVRQSAIFGAAATPASSGSASNNSAMTFGPFSSSAAITGLFLADTVSSNTGNMLWFGNLTTPRTPLTGDSLVIAVGALQITLA